jgi:hypothetical protein
MAVDIGKALASFSAYIEPRDGFEDNPFRLACALSTPATPGEIQSAWPGRPLPAELVEAWSISRETRLFEDIDYGQWGLVLLSPTASARRTAEQRTNRPSDYSTDDIVIGEFLGDLELLVMAPSQTGDQRILIALPLDDRPDWYSAASSFTQFLNRYRESHGGKYWEAAT